MHDHNADDFSAFRGSEHMFFGLSEPYTMIRQEVEAALRRQVSDTVLEAIRTFDTPKFLTLGCRTDDDDVLVTHFGFSVRATLQVSHAGGHEREILDSLLTFLFAHIDRLGEEKCRTYFDFHEDAQQCFDDDVFKRRFLAYRAETGQHGADLDGTIA